MTLTEPGVPAGGIGRAVKRGAAMAGGAVILVQFVSIAQTLALGRLLGPELVGLYTAGAVLVSFVMTVAQGALSQALIHREHDIEDAANTVMVVTACTGLLFTLASLAAAPLLGEVFNDHRVALVAAAVPGVMLLHSLTIVPDALMQRAFRFAPRMIIAPAVSIAFAATAVVLALRGLGVWSMVIGHYVSMVVWVVLSWSLARWRPFRGRFDFRLWREMGRFSLPLAFDNLAERLRELLEQLIIGRALGTTNLGQFRYAFRIGSIPTIGIVQGASYVLFPAFAKIAGDAERFRAAFLRALSWLWLAALPVCALMLVVGEPVVVLLLGQEWRPAGTATQALAGMGLGIALATVGAEAAKGAGRSSLLTWQAVLQLVLGLSLVVLLVPYGLVGVGIAISSTQLVIGVVAIISVRSVVGVSFRDIGAALAPATAAAVLALAAAAPLRLTLLDGDSHGVLHVVAVVCGIVAAFLAVYLVTVRVLDPEKFRAVGRVLARRKGAGVTS
ncbi:oligosaccharide flippase family protein [Mycolicibacterium arseniciresistens]|uniref:Oligosaccharide flippase family protein n=1 Tax=Mycolicibacterium arseniciresistens TaxID=3062257 RepID=A0ABT8UGE9_9MYCO|nr:oligosaccharide flippase family protein [Mycolicibacterium arseniciresistens]MDO3636843.1 oligosaccharide flippase family protein [Mycolicibacterium arseniciresistens]